MAILTKAAEKGYLSDISKTLESLKLAGFHFSTVSKELIKNQLYKAPQHILPLHVLYSTINNVSQSALRAAAGG